MSRKLMVVLLVVSVVLAACGAPQGSSNEVTVTLTEFGFESSRTSFEVGVPYRFVVTNEGVVEHEIMIMPPLTEEQMAMEMDMHELDELALVAVEAENLQSGDTTSFEYTFTEPVSDGSLEFACHVEGHYEAGMKLPITVK